MLNTTKRKIKVEGGDIIRAGKWRSRTKREGGNCIKIKQVEKSRREMEKS